MAYFDDETSRKKKAASLLLLMQLREHDEQLLQAQHLLLQVQLGLFSIIIYCYLLSSIRQCTYLVLLIIFQGRGKPRRRRKQRSMWVRKWLSDERRERYGHYTTLLNELKTEDEKAFFNYTRLPRGLYDEVMRRIEGRIQKKDT